MGDLALDIHHQGFGSGDCFDHNHEQSEKIIQQQQVINGKDIHQSKSNLPHLRDAPVTRHDLQYHVGQLKHVDHVLDNLLQQPLEVESSCISGTNKENDDMAGVAKIYFPVEITPVVCFI